MLKCCTQQGSTFEEVDRGHRTRKGQFSFQSQRQQCKRTFKLLYNCAHFTCQQGNAQNPSSQALTICELRISRCTSWFQKRQRNQKSNCQHPLDHQKSKRVPEKHLFFSRKAYFCFIDYAKDFVWITINWKILKEMGIPYHLTCLLRNLYAGQE